MTIGPVTCIGINLGSKTGEQDFLAGVRVVSAGRNGSRVYGRTLNHGETDSGEGISIESGETLEFPAGDHAFELRVGEASLGEDLERQFRAVGRARMGHRGHRRRLHQGRGMGLRLRDPDGDGPPRFIGSGGRRRLRRGRMRGIDRGGLAGRRWHVVGKLRDGSPNACVGLGSRFCACRRRVVVARGAGRRLEGKTAGGFARAGLRDKGPARRHAGLNGGKHRGGIGRGVAGGRSSRRTSISSSARLSFSVMPRSASLGSETPDPGWL